MWCCLGPYDLASNLYRSILLVLPKVWQDRKFSAVENWNCISLYHQALGMALHEVLFLQRNDENGYRSAQQFLKINKLEFKYTKHRLALFLMFHLTLNGCRAAFLKQCWQVDHQTEHLHTAMCIELATQKGWRRYAFPCFISFILRYLSQTERYSQVLWLIWKLI